MEFGPFKTHEKNKNLHEWIFIWRLQCGTIKHIRELQPAAEKGWSPLIISNLKITTNNNNITEKVTGDN